MKSTLAILLSSLAVTFCVHADDASATNPANSATATPASSEAAPATSAQPVGCLTDTGSRIKRKSRKCLNVTGRSYDRDDVVNTGQTNVGDALRQLDPSVGTGIR